ncbi:hypothetical protein [Candidatus Coxiella mudrowiae]|uniref:hypothetical protein n=1 Tax=Candidatus Coxiella mudrowiae TaxID=2054173 RepID=UPI0006625A8B|nr:hypothetical protein [Candidatus Coxiella mudrowiae]
MNSAFILPNEVKSNYELINQRRDFRYFIILSVHFYGKIKVTPKMVADYYYGHRQAFEASEKVSISYLLLSPEILRHQVVVIDVEIKKLIKEFYASSGEKRSLEKVKEQIKQALIQQKINTLLTKKSD